MSDGPQNITTKELPAVKVPVDQLTEILTAVRATSNKVDAIEHNVEMLLEDSRDTKLRLTRLEGRVDGYEVRAEKHSGGLARASKTDEGHAAAIAHLVGEVSELKASQATQTAILERLDAIAKNPLVKQIATVLATAFLSWAAMKGLR